MKRELKDLSKEEWDKLFPIALHPHDPKWPLIYKDEKDQIVNRLGNSILKIEHVGSTAIPAIKAKSYIDISIEILVEHLFNEEIIQSLEKLGYTFFRQEGKDLDYMVFVKGYNLNGEIEQVFHIHMYPSGHELLHQITFRDYLIANPERAKQYENLKTQLADQHKNDRVGYRVAKDNFILETLDLAKKL
ncbi:GrpB domain, predicted nucleotidyltransferase, UPF0157 family [Marivirga sericea]|uniref:GrpB domain, predicted nucleotidyltransferase, UPF0157 family n=1 Tax=Marivirga sericea TaxID=1028 RepID=A0A1X7K9C0_9BACT|nr:GrpB family protein [Marivirga sericea]SMG37651.1 GrpB domain, predicted nucleotidyltransferase, UPF0157 family [Marivirga sericea]